MVCAQLSRRIKELTTIFKMAQMILFDYINLTLLNFSLNLV